MDDQLQAINSHRQTVSLLTAREALQSWATLYWFQLNCCYRVFLKWKMSTALIFEPVLCGCGSAAQKQRKKKTVDERGKATEYYAVVVFE